MPGRASHDQKCQCEICQWGIDEDVLRYWRQRRGGRYWRERLSREKRESSRDKDRYFRPKKDKTKPARLSLESRKLFDTIYRKYGQANIKSLRRGARGKNEADDIIWFATGEIQEHNKQLKSNIYRHSYLALAAYYRNWIFYDAAYDTDDLSQDCFLKLLQREARGSLSLAEVKTMSGWLVRALKTTYIDKVKAIKAKKRDKQTQHQVKPQMYRDKRRQGRHIPAAAAVLIHETNQKIKQVEAIR